MGNKQTVDIYALLCPVSGAIRYIGKANNAQNRFEGHMRETRRKTPLYSWIASLRKDGKIPVLKIIDVCRPDNWKDTERFAIAKARESGADLLNIADGGDEPFCSKEVRASNGRKVAALRTSTPLKAKIYKLKKMIGQCLRDGSVPEQVKAKLRLAAFKNSKLFGEYATL